GGAAAALAAQGSRGALQPARTRPCGNGLALPMKAPTLRERQASPGAGEFWGGEERRAEVGARSALCRLTRGGCLNAANASERSEFDRATSGRAPQRSRSEAKTATA
ncbi:MAG: hypothetical protein KGK18_18970, partial [Burkholderiales bacterium]|nr:hypothetical protein [Burkholderiales bacterium]